MIELQSTDSNLNAYINLKSQSTDLEKFNRLRTEVLKL